MASRVLPRLVLPGGVGGEKSAGCFSAEKRVEADCVHAEQRVREGIRPRHGQLVLRQQGTIPLVRSPLPCDMRAVF